MRIVLCGYEGNHGIPDTWMTHLWKTNGGMANQALSDSRGKDNKGSERIWFSPYCKEIEMKVVYTSEEMPEKFSKSIFLAGPTPRNPEEQESWRPDAIEILRDKGYDGIIFAPEGRDGKFKMDYDDRIAWEAKLNVADVIVFSGTERYLS